MKRIRPAGAAAAAALARSSNRSTTAAYILRGSSSTSAAATPAATARERLRKAVLDQRIVLGDPRASVRTTVAVGVQQRRECQTQSYLKTRPSLQPLLFSGRVASFFEMVAGDTRAQPPKLASAAYSLPTQRMAE